MFNHNSHALVLDVLDKIISIFTKHVETVKLIRKNNTLDNRISIQHDFERTVSRGNKTRINLKISFRLSNYQLHKYETGNLVS